MKKKRDKKWTNWVHRGKQSKAWFKQPLSCDFEDSGVPELLSSPQCHRIDQIYIPQHKTQGQRSQINASRIELMLDSSFYPSSDILGPSYLQNHPTNRPQESSAECIVYLYTYIPIHLYKLKCMVNVGKYSKKHGASGNPSSPAILCPHPSGHHLLVPVVTCPNDDVCTNDMQPRESLRE